jgi:hypothetical protein
MINLHTNDLFFLLSASLALCFGSGTGRRILIQLRIYSIKLCSFSIKIYFHVDHFPMLFFIYSHFTFNFSQHELINFYFYFYYTKIHSLLVYIGHIKARKLFRHFSPL